MRAIQGMLQMQEAGCGSMGITARLLQAFDVNVGVHQGSVLNPLLFPLVLEALSHEFRTAAQWELLYADYLVIIADSLEECVTRHITWKEKMEERGFPVNTKKTKFLVSGNGLGVLKKEGRYPCSV